MSNYGKGADPTKCEMCHKARLLTNGLCGECREKVRDDSVPS